MGATTRNVHERLDRTEQVAGSSNRSFGVVFAVVFAAIGFWSVVFDGGEPRLWAIVIAAGFLFAAILRPSLLAPLNRVWLRIGLVLHKIVNPVVMGFIFFVVITPVAIAMRLAGRDALRLKRDDAAETYWLVRTPPGPEPETMKDQF